MHLMGFIDQNTCSLCPNTVDNYVHALWFCTPVLRFWEEVTGELGKIINTLLPLSPSFALLGDLSSTTISHPLQTFILVALTVAKKTILLNWKDRTKISKYHWLNLLSDHANLEKLTHSHKDNITTFHETWSPFLLYIQN